MNTVSSVGMISALLLSGAAQALDWSQDWSDWEVRPRISTGIVQYKFEQDALFDLGNDIPQVLSAAESEDSMLFAEVGVSAFFGNFFVDLSFQKSGEGEDDFKQEVFAAQFLDGEPAVVNPLSVQEDSQREMERDEFSLSVGYAFSDRFGVFAGYKKNETNFDDRGARQFTSLLFDLTTTVVRDSELSQDGFFLGATYVWPFESAGWLSGALSLDIGVAFLDGDLSQSSRQTSADLDEPILRDAKLSGDAVGLNLGIAWSGPLTERLSYTVGVDGYQYDYEGDDESTDFQDTLFRYSVGVSYALGGS